jgi:hypothetical protein
MKQGGKIMVPMFCRVILLLVVCNSAALGGSGLKPGPHGIYALLPAYNSERPVDLDRPVWSNPLVQGVTIRTVWKNVQPAAQTLDWTYFDTAIATARSHGKSVGLSLAAGIFTPDWVYENGAARFNFTQVGPYIPATPKTMPEPWDTAFLAQWGATISAMGRRYDGNPMVAYMMIGGLGFSIESVYVKTPEDIARLQSLGGAAQWLAGAEKIVDLYAAAFPHTPFIYAMAPPIKGDMSVTKALVEYGVKNYPGRFGIMHDGLNATSAPDFYPDHAVTVYSAKTPAGFQMVWSTDGPEGAARVKGTLGQALSLAVLYNAHWVEVYEVDCQNAAYAGNIRAASQQLAGRVAQ